MGGTGRQQIEVIKDGNFVNKEVTNEWKVEAERLHFLVAVVSWEDAQGQAVERAGFGVCVAFTYIMTLRKSEALWSQLQKAFGK